MGIKTVIGKVDGVLGMEISEEREPRPKLGPVADLPVVGRWGGVIAAVSFVAIGLPYLQADLWFDELLTLNNYAVRVSLGEVLSSYKVANNHILFSALLWAWLRVFGQGNEAFLRLPGVILSLATLYIAYVHSRSLFKHAAAALFVTLLFAFNPVYICFFSQLRGYSLTIMLSTVATLGAIYLAVGRFGRGTLMFCVGAFFLPMVLPSNLATTGALFLFVNLFWLRQRRWLRRLVHLLLPAFATVAGLVIYVPIWKKVLHVMATTAGWPSGWAVVGNWAVALLACFGLFMLACFGLRRQKDVKMPDEVPEDLVILRQALPWLGGVALVCLTAVALLRTPFPRSFLGLLPAFVFAAMMGYRRCLVRVNKYFYLLIFFILANFMVVTRVSSHLGDRALYQGEYPQDLLQQYYSRKRDVSMTMRFLAQQAPLPPNARILADFHLFLSAKQYWNALGRDPRAVECLNNSTERFQLQGNPEQYAYLPCIVLAYDREQAIRSFRKAYGLDIELSPLPSPTDLRIFRLIGPMPSRRAPTRPNMPLLPEADDAI